MLGSNYCQNGDTLGTVEPIVWLEQGNQGDQREQYDQSEVSIILFGMSESSEKKLAYVGCFRHFVCVFVFVILFVL